MKVFLVAGLVFAATLSIILPAYAADVQPGASCAAFAAGAYRPTGGPENPDGALLVCDGSVWQPILRYSSSGNAVSLGGGSLPAAPLHVWGEAIIGSNGLACSPAAEGAIRYTGGDPPWEFCNGADWVNFKQPRCQDDDTGECYLDATRANDDPDFTPENITCAANILGVVGACPEADVTWDPINKATSISLQNNNLDATASNSEGVVVATHGLSAITAQKAYFEVEVIASNDSAEVGIKDGNFTNLDNWHFYIAGSNAHYDNWYREFEVGSNSGAGWSVQTGSNPSTRFSAGDRLMWALDRSTGKIWHGRNGTWFGSGDPAAGTNHTFNANSSDPWFPSVGPYGGTLRLHTKESDFQHSIPSGYVGFAKAVYQPGGGGCTAPSSCPNVGDVCSDGSIFAGFMVYNNSSCEPLYVTDNNQSTSSQWKNATGTDDISTDDHVDGQINSATRSGNISNFPAFGLCESNTYHAKSDWYLPARAELLLLWLNRAAIDANAAGNFATSYYWTSTEDNNNKAWYQNMGYGDQYSVRLCGRIDSGIGLRVPSRNPI